MDGDTREALRGRWVRGHRAAHNRETITLVELPDGTWEVRRTGASGGTAVWPNRALAEACVTRMVGDAWIALPVRQPDRWNPAHRAAA
jgi:hypothetical protein